MAKSKYDTHVKFKLTMVESWARDGLTDKQIAHNLGISEESFYKYKKEHVEFSESLKKGKEVIDYEVENALLKRALGYSYTETRVKKEYGKVVEEVSIEKEVAPDTTAQIFWLKNRRPDKWRDKKNVEHSGEVANPYQDLSTQELRELIGKDNE